MPLPRVCWCSRRCSTPALPFCTWNSIVENPVFTGDTIHAECEIVEARRSKSRPDRGLVRTRIRVVKQDDIVALTYTPLRMVKCREPSA